MASTMIKKNAIYEGCAHLEKKIPDMHVNEKIAKEIATNYNTLPSFESSLFDQVFINHYSLERNERLKCYWEAYLKNIETRIFSPFYFPNSRHLHFHNSTIRYLPSETTRPDYRKKLKPGPGVDYAGQMPIPQELHMNRDSVPKEVIQGKNNKKKFLKRRKK